MAATYKVWVEIEQIDESNDIYETIAGHEAKCFESLPAAERYVDYLFRTLTVIEGEYGKSYSEKNKSD